MTRPGDFCNQVWALGHSRNTTKISRFVTWAAPWTIVRTFQSYWGAVCLTLRQHVTHSYLGVNAAFRRSHKCTPVGAGRNATNPGFLNQNPQSEPKELLSLFIPPTWFAWVFSLVGITLVLHRWWPLTAPESGASSLRALYQGPVTWTQVAAASCLLE